MVITSKSVLRSTCVSLSLLLLRKC